jgi:predicted O-methyltransferase YrrM
MALTDTLTRIKGIFSNGAKQNESPDMDIEFLNSVLKNKQLGTALNRESYYDLLNEVLENKALAHAYESNLPLVRKVNPKHQFHSWNDRARSSSHIALINLVYMTTRLLRPKIIIETGCATGAATALFLAAIEKNGEGFHYSIDLPVDQPKADVTGLDWPKDVPIGYLVPSEYRKNWKLIQGDSIKELPELFQKLKDVDMFFHDSCHTYEHMTFEYAVAERNMRPGTCLISDDISANLAFAHYFQERNKKALVNPRNKNTGIVILG